jgi:hypothetical protein
VNGFPRFRIGRAPFAIPVERQVIIFDEFYQIEDGDAVAGAWPIRSNISPIIRPMRRSSSSASRQCVGALRQPQFDPPQRTADEDAAHGSGRIAGNLRQAPAGTRHLGMNEKVKKIIVDTSQGLPSFTHLPGVGV